MLTELLEKNMFKEKEAGEKSKWISQKNKNKKQNKSKFWLMRMR